jgi:hypothetical protein
MSPRINWELLPIPERSLSVYVVKLCHHPHNRSAHDESGHRSAAAGWDREFSSRSSCEGGSETSSLVPSVTSVPPTGRRQAFRDLRRQLTESDLASPGVQKLILDDLEQSEVECEELRAYIERYHEADKRAGILEERLKPARAVEVFFGVGVGVGGIIMGLAPVFWTQQPQGIISLVLGALLVIGSVIGRLVRG